MGGVMECLYAGRIYFLEKDRSRATEMLDMADFLLRNKRTVEWARSVLKKLSEIYGIYFET